MQETCERVCGYMHVPQKDHATKAFGDGSFLVTPPHAKSDASWMTAHLRRLRKSLGRHKRMFLTRNTPDNPVDQEPLVVQQIPKSLPREAPVSKVSLRKSLSIENLVQIEAPWQGVTLNRCLFIAITILVLTSGCQRLHEFLRGHKEEMDIEPICSVLNSRHTAVRKYRLAAPEPEASLWDTFFWWVSEDDDEEKGRRRGKSRKVTQEKATRGLRHKAIPDRRLLKGREGSFKARRAKAKQDERKSRESVKAQQEKVKKLQEKKLNEEGRKGKEEKIVKSAVKESKKNAS